MLAVDEDDVAAGAAGAFAELEPPAVADRIIDKLERVVEARADVFPQRVLQRQWKVCEVALVLDLCETTDHTHAHFTTLLQHTQS